MKAVKYAILAMLAIAVPGLASEQPKLDELQKKAMAKDYQAQRNLAYGYETGDQKVPIDRMKGCMWRKVILLSGSQRVDQTDVLNHRVSCGKLDADEQAVVTRQAEVLAGKLYR